MREWKNIEKLKKGQWRKVYERKKERSKEGRWEKKKNVKIGFAIEMVKSGRKEKNPEIGNLTNQIYCKEQISYYVSY